MNSTMLWLLIIGFSCTIPISNGLQCHCSSTVKVSEKHKDVFIAHEDCKNIGGIYIRTCSDGSICVKSQGTMKNGEKLLYQGCTKKPDNLKLGCTRIPMPTQSGEKIVGTECYCNTDLCNSDSENSNFNHANSKGFYGWTQFWIIGSMLLSMAFYFHV